MHQASQEQSMARHVRGLYNYQVGQRAAVGRLLLWVFGVSALLFWGTLAFDMVSQLAHGFARAFFAH
jgi:hypothetical protein